MEARERQERTRNLDQAGTPAIVADLSAGFWVSQLSGSYEVTYVWRHNLPRIFPNEPKLDQMTAWQKSDAILRLRNRVAHHEPIYRLKLKEIHQDMQFLVAAMCPATKHFADQACNFDETLKTWDTAIPKGRA
jgi:hypothetical protein